MSANAVMGHEGQWTFITSNANPSTSAFGGATVSFPVVSDTMGKAETLGYSKGIRGTRGQKVEGARTTAIDLAGTLTVEASPQWLAFIIPQITGDVSTPYRLQESIGYSANAYGFDYQRYDGIANKSYRFRNCLINRLQLNYGGSEFVTMTLDLLAHAIEEDITYSGAVLPTTIDYEPYIPSELAMTGGVSAGALDIESAVVTISQNLQVRRRMQITPGCYLAGIREVSLAAEVEWGATNEGEIYNLGETGYPHVLTLQRGAMSNVLTLPEVQAPSRTPGITNPDEILYSLQGIARATGATGYELDWTNDATP